MSDHDPFAAADADTEFRHERWQRAGATEEEVEALANHHADQATSKQWADAVAIDKASDNELAEALSVMRGEHDDDQEGFEPGLFVDTPKRPAAPEGEPEAQEGEEAGETPPEAQEPPQEPAGDAQPPEGEPEAQEGPQEGTQPAQEPEQPPTT